MFMKKSIVFSITLFCLSILAHAQDTIKIKNLEPKLLSSRNNKVYFFMPAADDTLNTDSVVVVNSKAYFKLVQDKQSCKTFINLYKMYQQSVSKGDAEVQGLIESYEVIIKTKDSSYTALMHEYYSLNSLLSASINQTESAILISKNSLDELSRSMDAIKEENEGLKTDLSTMKQQNNKNKWRFGLAGLGVGLLLGILIMH